MAVFMTDEQMLHSLLGLKDVMASHGDTGYLPALDEVIAELRRRIVLETDRSDIIGVLKSVHSALDVALGDTDISHIENDDELREEHPVQWAAEWLAHSIELLEAAPQALAATPAFRSRRR